MITNTTLNPHIAKMPHASSIAQTNVGNYLGLFATARHEGQEQVLQSGHGAHILSYKPLEPREGEARQPN